MTHEYTLLVGGTVIPGGGAPDATAIAWAEGIVLAIGPEADVRAISRGDSHFVDLHGAFVVPLAPDGDVTWPSSATLEVGGRANLAVLPRDPRVAAAGDVEARPVTPLALIRGGRVVTGTLPGVHGP